MSKVTEQQVIKWAEDYAEHMRDFIKNDPNAKYNQRAVDDAKELMAFMSIYKYGSEWGKKYALKWLTAVYKNS
jgi:hypothetical protein